MHIQPGIEISCNGRLGTLGLILKRQDDPNLYLLSCWHVLDGGEGSCDVSLPNNEAAAVPLKVVLQYFKASLFLGNASM